MSLQTDIDLFVSRANTKLIEYTDIIEPLLRIGDQSDNVVKKSVELIDLIETVTNPTCPWTEAEIYQWMNFMTERHELQDIVYQDYDPYIIPTIIVEYNGSGISLAQLLAALVPYTNKDIDLQEQIDALEIAIGAILPPTLVADLAALTIIVNGHTTTIGTLVTNVSGLAADLADHILDEDVHIQPGERESWNARVTQAELIAALEDIAPGDHSHAISEVTGLPEALEDLQEQIDLLPTPVDGITPDIQIGTITEGDAPLVELDPSSTPEVPIFNFTLKSGDPFNINMIGPLADRSDYDDEDSGFTYMDEDTGEVYFRISDEVGAWSLPIQFRGYNGWTPVWGYLVVNETTVVKQFIEFTGGTGPVPNLNLILGQPDETVYYAGTTGFVTDINLAVNVQGPRGERFKIDAEGSTRSTHDAELKGFTFLNTVTGKVSFKLSNTAAHWSAEYAWTNIGSSSYLPSGPTNVDVGGIPAGTDLGSSPMLIQSLLDSILYPIVHPVFSAFSISGQDTTVEVGTTLSGSKTFLWTLSLGTGTVATIDIYDITDAATLLAGTPNDGSEAQVITSILLNANGATQQWRAIANNTTPAETINSGTFTVTARFYRFFGPAAASPTDSATVRALSLGNFHESAYQTSFILNTGTTETKFVVALPPGVTISSVIDLDAFGADLTANYVLTGTIDVLDAGGTNRSYNIYEMDVAIPYSVSHRHQVTV